MMRFLMFIFFITSTVRISDGEEIETELGESQEITMQVVPQPDMEYHPEINLENSIEELERMGALAEKTYREGIVPKDEIEKLYKEMVEILDDILEMFKDNKNIYSFLKAKGIDRIIVPNLDVKNTQLRSKLLVILKILFDVAPTTTKTVIPINVIDKLLDIFENDDNLGLKAHTLDIFNVWLPKNPMIQARVMKLKGLELFYHQIPKLDTNVIHTILNLFNKIIKEHLDIRNNKSQRRQIDSENQILYQRIGLIERLSTQAVCNGILNIFKTTWSYSTKENDIIVPIIELVMNIKLFCLSNYKGKTNAVEFFDALLKYVGDDNKKKYLEDMKINATNLEAEIKNYVEHLKKPVRDEF